MTDEKHTEPDNHDGDEKASAAAKAAVAPSGAPTNTVDGVTTGDVKEARQDAEDAERAE